MAEKEGFFDELKRRHVWRTALAYAVAGWLLVQIATQVFPIFHMPEWTEQIVVVLVVLGFPLAVTFAWVYEITPEGIRRTEPAESAAARPENAHREIGRKLNAVIIAVLILAVGLLGWRLLLARRAPQPVPVASQPEGRSPDGVGAPEEAQPDAGARAADSTADADSAGLAAVAPKTAASFNPAKDTLVVLPFKNLSGDPTHQYFSDGITQELTSALGQNPALRVIAWETASTLRDPGLTAREVGKELDVANVLYGSIARAGGKVRISVELVSTVTGYELWSQHYDDAFADVFAVQDKVSQAIAQTLKLKFAEADLPAGGTRNPEAHEMVLKSRALIDKFDAVSLEAARQDIEKALALDPAYADAHALLSRTLLALTERSDLPLARALPRIRAEAEHALALDPRNADAWVALGNVGLNATPPRIAKAQESLERALKLDPSNVSAHIDYGNTLPIKAALAQDRSAVLLDPANIVAWNNLAVNSLDAGDWSEVIEAGTALARLNPAYVDSAFLLTFAHRQLHQYDAVAGAFGLVHPANPVDREQVAAGRLVYRSLENPALRPQAIAALRDLSKHQSNLDVAGNLLQLWLALDQKADALDLLKELCPADPVACRDLAVTPVCAPLRGQPAFRQLAKKYSVATLQ